MGTLGVVKTEPLFATTRGQNHSLTFTPKTGTLFAKFYITNCSVPALNGTYEVTGKVTGVPDGATVNFKHEEVTKQGNLKTRGAASGLEGTLTLKGKDEAKGDLTYSPLSVTTQPYTGLPE